VGLLVTSNSRSTPRLVLVPSVSLSLLPPVCRPRQARHGPPVDRPRTSSRPSRRIASPARSRHATVSSSLEHTAARAWWHHPDGMNPASGCRASPPRASGPCHDADGRPGPASPWTQAGDRRLQVRAAFVLAGRATRVPHRTGTAGLVTSPPRPTWLGSPPWSRCWATCWSWGWCCNSWSARSKSAGSAAQLPRRACRFIPSG
jgi:hypothetical protein